AVNGQFRALLQQRVVDLGGSGLSSLIKLDAEGVAAGERQRHGERGNTRANLVIAPKWWKLADELRNFDLKFGDSLTSVIAVRSGRAPAEARDALRHDGGRNPVDQLDGRFDGQWRNV